MEAARTPLCIASAHHKSGALQDLEVLGDGGEADAERAGQIGDRGFAAREPGEDGAPRGIGEGGEGGAEMVGGHLYVTSWLNNHLVKYAPLMAGSSAARLAAARSPFNHRFMRCGDAGPS